jgi:hypothetical protein
MHFSFQSVQAFLLSFHKFCHEMRSAMLDIARFVDRNYLKEKIKLSLKNPRINLFGMENVGLLTYHPQKIG